MFRPLRITVLAVILCLPSQAYAAKVKVWQQNAPSHYEKAQLKQAVVSNEGTLRLSRQLKPLTQLDVTHIWDVVEDKEGNLFVATGDEGKIYKVTPDGKNSVVYTGEDSQILCLAQAPDGIIYAGTGPAGHIIRIDPKGTSKILANTKEGYVWSLVFDPRTQTLFAGTGPKGRICQVTADGKTSVFYTTKQEHILCLALAGDGTLYAGTDKNGLVYRIDAKGKGFVVYNAPQSEIRSLRVTAEAIYVGTSSPNRRRFGGGGSIGSGTSSPLGTSSPSPVSSVKGKEEPAGGAVRASSGSSSASEAREPSRGSPAASVPPPNSGENSLYRIAHDGTVRELFRERTLVLSMLRQNGKVFVGTGMEGQLFEIDEANKERSEIARLDHGQILCLLRRQDGSILVGTGDPGKLYVLQDKYTVKGTLTSEVHDAKIISKWGALRWKGETPAGTSLTVAVRTGNVSEPDDTWSDWSAELTDPDQSFVPSPSARFLQYRVTLASKDPALTPSFNSLALRYVNTNQSPEISSIEVPDLDSANLENPKKLKFSWKATDANEDELTYSLYIRKDGWKSWVQLEDSLDKKEYEWDTTTTPSGTYQVKIVASDRKDNSEEDTLSAERISTSFIVAHTPPTVTIKVVGMDGEQAILEATASDPQVRLVSASFAVNGKKWVNVFPTDGLFDSKSENFRFKTESLKPGTYVVVLRVRDAAGNTGSGDVVFGVQARTAQK